LWVAIALSLAVELQSAMEITEGRRVYSRVFRARYQSTLPVINGPKSLGFGV
jgi:hypothetical protein